MGQPPSGHINLPTPCYLTCPCPSASHPLTSGFFREAAGQVQTFSSPPLWIPALPCLVPWLFLLPHFLEKGSQTQVLWSPNRSSKGVKPAMREEESLFPIRSGAASARFTSCWHVGMWTLLPGVLVLQRLSLDIHAYANSLDS